MSRSAFGGVFSRTSLVDPRAHPPAPPPQNNQVNAEMESDPHRVILNQPDANDHHKNNFISTTKYNPATFLPRVLYVQFRRFANFYFLMVVVVALSSPASPVLKETAVLPLAFVLGVSIIKEAIEDNVCPSSPLHSLLVLLADPPGIPRAEPPPGRQKGQQHRVPAD